ncbi:MAG: J domain-containing protein [Promethearchaeota archaeon]|jgi:hypothetical protein
MKDCWNILGIPSTNDKEVIKKAYRDLVKKYHPDMVLSPEKKRKYTIRCAEINTAYKEALNLASISMTIVHEHTDYTQKENLEPWYYNIYRFSIVIFSFFAVIIGSSFFIYLIKELPDSNIIKLSISGITILIISIFFGGIGIAGTMDIFLIYFFPRNVFSKLGFEKYEFKIIWLLVLAANLWLFNFTELADLFPSNNSPIDRIHSVIWRAAGSGTIPLWFFLNWLREIWIYKKIKRESFDLILTDSM